MTPNAHILPVRLLILSVALASAFLLFGAQVEAGTPPVVETYVVERGDTLWSIAERLSPPGEDVRETVDLLRDLNRLSGAELRPGQRLVVPSG